MTNFDNHNGNHSDWQDAGDEFDQERLVTLEAEIAGAHVPIWRQFVIPASYPLDELHFVIAMLFDWSGECPYCFTCGPFVYKHPRDEAVRLASLRQSGVRTLDSTLTAVGDLFSGEGSSADYYYDAAELARELWHLTIHQVGELTGAEYPFSMVPLCIDGAGNNPPEDVGGVAGYVDLCNDLRNVGAAGHQSALSWLGLESERDFDPELFDLEETNYFLARDQVDAYERELVPSDPERLRELVKDLLAEEAVREATDILRMSQLAEQLSTPAGQRIVQMILQEAFSDEGFYPDNDATTAAPWGAAFSGLSAWGGHGGSSTSFREEEPPAHGRIIPMRPANAPADGATAAPAGAGAGAGAGAAPAGAPVGKAAPAGKATPIRAFSVSRGKLRARDRVPQPNALLDSFEATMRQGGLSEKTVKKHLANAEYFLNVYLPDNGLSVREGSRRMDDYFGFYLPQNCPWLTLTSLKENVASIRKLYGFLLVEGQIDMEDRKFLEETIAEFKDEWYAGF